MKLTTISTNDDVKLHDGKYEGKMSGYMVSVKRKAADIDPALSLAGTHKIEVGFETVQGIRGTMDVTVIVENGFAVVTTETQDADSIAADLIRMHKAE
jgi:hypothetical protein